MRRRAADSQRPRQLHLPIHRHQRLPGAGDQRRPGACGADAQHAEHRSRQRHHLRAAKQALQDDLAVPHAEYGRLPSRQGLLDERGRGPRETLAPPFRRLYLLAEVALLDPVGIHALRRARSAKRQHQHRTRRYCLLYAQQQLEYRFRTDQDQGEPGESQLLERIAVC